MTDKKLKDRRLNKEMRARLKRWASSQIKCPEERERYAALYREALPQVVAVVQKRYPEADLEVLRRHDLVQKDFCFFMESTDTQNRFELDSRIEPIKVLEVAKNGPCWGRVYMVDKELRNLVQSVNLAEEQWRTAITKKFDKYKSAIEAATTFNELAAIWPALESVRSEYVPEQAPLARALTVMSADTIAFIQSDNAGATA